MGLWNLINKTRLGTILNYICLIFMVLIFEYGNIYQWSTTLLIIGIIALLIFIISFIYIYIKTGLWEFIHKPLKDLDEREIALTSKSLRYAYGIFTVILLFLLLLLAIFELPLNVVLVGALIIFAHILPASIIAWSERGIKYE